MRIAVYVNDDDVVVRAEVYNEAQTAPIEDSKGFRVRSVSESVITDSNGKRLTLEYFLSNPVSFVCGDDGLVKQVGSKINASVIPDLDMTVPFAFQRANTVRSYGSL